MLCDAAPPTIGEHFKKDLQAVVVNSWDRDRTLPNGEDREGPQVNLVALSVSPNGEAETKASADLAALDEMQDHCGSLEGFTNSLDDMHLATRIGAMTTDNATAAKKEARLFGEKVAELLGGTEGSVEATECDQHCKQLWLKNSEKAAHGKSPRDDKEEAGKWMDKERPRELLAKPHYIMRGQWPKFHARMDKLLRKAKADGEAEFADVPDTVRFPPLGLDGKWGTDKDAALWLRDYKPLLIRLLTGLLENKTNGGLKADDWRKRSGACQQLLDWVQNPVTYSGSMFILDIASFVTAEQDWSQAHSPYWQLGSGFRYVELPGRNLTHALPMIERLQEFAPQAEVEDLEDSSDDEKEEDEEWNGGGPDYAAFTVKQLKEQIRARSKTPNTGKKAILIDQLLQLDKEEEEDDDEEEEDEDDDEEDEEEADEEELTIPDGLFPETKKFIDSANTEAAEIELAKIKKRLLRGASRLSLEMRYWLHKWFEIPRLFGLAFDPIFGPLFLSHALRHLKERNVIDWELPEHFKLQDGVDDDVAARIEALFEPEWHAKYRKGISAKHHSVYKVEIPEEYDPIDKLVQFWGDHQLSRFKDDWLKLVGRDASDEKGEDGVPHFWRSTVDEDLFDWAIDEFLVKSHNNNGVEGLFNLVEIYGSAQLDNLKLEMVVQYVKNVLARERSERREAKFRIRKEEAGKPLQKHLRNKKQKTRAAEQCVEWSDKFTNLDLKGARERGQARMRKRRAYLKGSYNQEAEQRSKKRAREEKQSYFVQAILDHRIVDTKAGEPEKTEYLVSWEDWDEEWDTWEDEDEVVECEALERYLLGH